MVFVDLQPTRPKEGYSRVGFKSTTQICILHGFLWLWCRRGSGLTPETSNSRNTQVFSSSAKKSRNHHTDFIQVWPELFSTLSHTTAVDHASTTPRSP